MMRSMRWLVFLVVVFLFGTASLCHGMSKADCLNCHSDKSLKDSHGVSIFVNADTLNASVHGEMECTDCHSQSGGNFDDAPHWKDYKVVSCADCHDDIANKWVKGFQQRLIERGYSKIPGCLDCHGKHAVTRETDKKLVCEGCHPSIGQDYRKSWHYSQYLKEGDKYPTCVTCHDPHTKIRKEEIGTLNHKREVVKICSRCHAEQIQEYVNSAHYRGLEAGNDRVPACMDCHENHSITRPDNPMSSVGPANLAKTCNRCHMGYEVSMHKKKDADPSVQTCSGCHSGHATDMNRVPGEGIAKFSIPGTCLQCHPPELHAKETSAHGEMMLTDARGNATNCTECHVYHWNMQATDKPELSQKRLECKNCHAKQWRDYEQSDHGIAYAKGHTEAPTCVTCHGSSNIQKVSEVLKPPQIIQLCSRCHEDRRLMLQFQLSDDVVKAYTKTYHGQVYQLGYQGMDFAACTNCHNAHLILNPKDPRSSVNTGNVVKVCRKCHPDANENFAHYIVHFSDSQGKKNPLLRLIQTFMHYLLLGVFAFFGLHTLLWFLRGFRERAQLKKQGILPDHAGGKQYLRFTLYRRILHGMVIVSFLTLAMTGLPLKYSHSGMAYFISHNVIGFQTAALMHRVAAVVTVTYFLLHLAEILYYFLLKRQKGMFWGPNSMIPQPRDAFQMLAHIKYFLGRGEKPKFDRWTYWEKFDYFAVFWGVVIIGSSGLVLWFPELFTKLLPGWAINAAHIIHSDEALLATGFIFSIHFFNSHLRPEKFPLDPVIFTGRISEGELQAERPLEWERYQSEGNGPQPVKEVSKMLRAFLITLGAIALCIGLVLLILIIAGLIGG